MARPSLLRHDFKYTPATSTDITATWRRFGFKPTTQAQRKARNAPNATPDTGIVVVEIEVAEVKAAPAPKPRLRMVRT